MTHEHLVKAMKLKEEIKDLEGFLFLAKRDGFWGKLVKKTKQIIFRQTIYGLSDGTDYKLGKELEWKVINLLERELAKMKKDLEKL